MASDSVPSAVDSMPLTSKLQEMVNVVLGQRFALLTLTVGLQPTASS
jgi:hypothetical protein